MKSTRLLRDFRRYVSFTFLGFLLTGAIAVSAQPIGYVTRQDSGEVLIVNLSNGSILGSIPTLDMGPTEIALSPDASTLYTTNPVTGFQDTVNVLDVASASPVQSILVGGVPIEIALLPDGSKLYTADWTSGTISVIDIITGTRISTIPTAFLSYDVAAAPDGTRVYATALLATDLFVIDTALDVVVDRIPIGRNFLGHVAITPDGRKAYITEVRNRVTVVDLDSRTVVGSIPFNATGVDFNNGALDIEIDRQGAFAYVLGFDAVNVIDLSTDTLVTTIPVGIQLSDVVIDSTGDFVYVTTLYQTIDLLPFNEIIKIDTSTFTIQDRFVIGGLLVGLAIAPTGEQPTIDIKPGSFRNSINPNSNGVIPVAILTTANFDATSVDPLSVLFGPSGAMEAHGRGHIKDVNGDGVLDLLLHFRTQDTGILCGDRSASLTGEKFDGMAFTGSDTIETVGCK